MSLILNGEPLRARISGRVVLPGDSEYDEARKVFNAMHDRRPAVIVQCASTADVVEAVNFAREHALLVAVRGGGHSVAGLSTCDDGIVIDLGGLKTVDVDPATKTARAGGGVLWGEFDAATQQHGLHTPGGRVTTTGLGGFTTGGGYGWTSSKYGLTCDNLVSTEVVLADGRVVTASEQENADLFWGLRGAGGNFGVVTEFTYRVHPLGPMVLAGLMLWPIEDAGRVMRAWRDYVDDAPDELSTACATLTAPPEPFVPDALKGQLAVGIVVIYVGDADEGASVVQPLRDLRPAVDLVQPMPYTAFQALLDPTAPKGFRSYWRGEYLARLSDGAIDAFAANAPGVTAAARPFSQVIVFRIGQGVAAAAGDATAFSHRDAAYLFHPISMWHDPADDERVIAANRSICEAMRPFSTGGAYLNFTPENRVRDGYDAGTYNRLVALKNKYDPTNLFKRNHNIAPTSTLSAFQPASSRVFTMAVCETARQPAGVNLTRCGHALTRTVCRRAGDWRSRLSRARACWPVRSAVACRRGRLRPRRLRPCRFNCSRSTTSTATSNRRPDRPVSSTTRQPVDRSISPRT